MRLPSRLPYSPLLRDCAGVDIVSEEPGRMEPAAGRFAGRLLDLREAGRELGVAERGRDGVDRGLADVALDFGELVRGMDSAIPDIMSPARMPLAAGLAGLDVVRRDVGRRADEARDDVLRLDVLRVDGREGDVLLAAGRRALVVRDVAARRAGLGGIGIALADDIVLAATVSALAAVIMALVAVFIDFIADDIVWAEVLALVAAAVILVAADVTLVAADDTVRAAVAGVAELRALLARRAAVGREAVERDAVDRDAVLRVDLEAVLREVALLAGPAGFAAVLRVVRDLGLDVLELGLDGRPAVPLDALRLPDLRAVLAELRRVAARVVD